MKKKLTVLVILVMFSVLVFGCADKNVSSNKFAPKAKEGYTGRVFYEIFVRAFKDSNKDGIGDLNGVTQNLTYLSDLGVKGIWLMPINTSPSYHGYDVSDYYNINPDYGTLDDFKKLVSEAHKKDIKVVMDLVINHSSDENPWLKAAALDKNSKYRDYYIWANKDTDVTESSAISAQPWTKSGSDYFYALFWEHMPDLNYDNKNVREEMKKVAKFYLDMGVDGFRLDAARWIYDDTDKNVEWWKEFNTYVKSVNKDAVLVGEVWDSNSEVIAPYMDALDSCFNFPVADELVKAAQSGSVGSLLGSIQNSYDAYKKANKEYTDSPFLTNHDINRAMSDIQNPKAYKSAAAILLTLPGTPYVYYGEETGMTGQKPDEQIREPFIWDNKDTSKNSSWEASTNDADTVAVSVQQKDKNSILNLYKALIKLRNENTALETGSFKFVNTVGDGVAAYIRADSTESIYVYVNFSNAESKEKLDIDKGEVIYTNYEDVRKTKIKGGDITIKPYEILIIRK